MLFFKIIRILETQKKEYNNEFENKIWSTFSYGNGINKKEIGSLVCEIKVLSGELEDGAELKFLSDVHLLGDIIEHDLINTPNTLKIRFRTIFLSGFDEMIYNIVKPNHKVIAIGKSEKENFREYKNHLKVLDFLSGIYLPSKKDVIKSLAKLAFKLEPSSTKTLSFYNLDKISFQKDFIYCFIKVSELLANQDEFETDFSINFKVKEMDEELSYYGYIAINPIDINNVVKKGYLKTIPFLDLPSFDSIKINKLNLTNHALAKYKTIYNSFTSLTRGESFSEENTQILGYPVSIQNDVIEEYENSFNPISKNISCTLVAQIIPNEISSEFNDKLGEGIIYILQNIDKETRTIVQYT
jgi:hypothetical protein